MKSIYFYILSIVLLLSMNIFLMYSNIKAKETLKTFIANSELIIHNKSLSGQKLIHPDIDLNKKGLTLSILVPNTSCSSCLEFEVPNMNELYEKYKSQVKVYILGQNSNYLKSYGFKYPVKVIDRVDPIFDMDYEFSNPIALLTSSNGYIYDDYVAEVGNSIKSFDFYNRMSSFLNEISE